MSTAAPPPSIGTAEAPATLEELERAVAGAREVADARTREHGRDGTVTEVAFGGGFLIVAAVLATVGPAPTLRDAALALGLAVALAVASRVVFESSGGGAVPTAPLVVAALFLVPLHLVPLVVLVGLVLDTVGSPDLRGARRLLVPAISGWNVLGPVAVLAVLDEPGPSLANWPWYLGALVAQFVVDALVAVVRVRSLGMSWRVLPSPMAFTCLVDLTLAPVGLTAVLAGEGSAWSVLLASTPVALLALLARDRAAHLEQAVAISEAFEVAVETARLDALTGIANRRAWNEATTRAAVRHAADPHGCPVTVVLGDLDRLKVVNDTHGHEAGDELIRAAARLLEEIAPPGALVARLGGDEFGILLTNPSVGATELLATIRERMRTADPVHGVAVSLSLGAASCPPLADVEAALSAADELAFADKTARRIARG